MIRTGGDPAMRFEEFLPGPAAAARVDRYWRFSVDPSGPDHIDHVIVPDGMISVSLALPPAGPVRVAVTGPSDRAHRARVFAGFRYGGVRFKAGAAPPVTNLRPIELRNRILVEHELDAAFAVSCAARLVPVFDPDPVGALDQIVEDWPDGGSVANSVVRDAAERLVAAEGLLSVKALAAEASLSERQFRRRFTAAAGLPPKSFAMIRRVRGACMLALGGSAGWAELAAAAGYADQSHLIRDMARIFGQTPRQLLAYIASINHDFEGGGIGQPRPNSSRPAAPPGGH